eukprot:sb/3475346/
MRRSPPPCLTDTSKKPIITRYLGHVIGYHLSANQGPVFPNKPQQVPPIQLLCPCRVLVVLSEVHGRYNQLATVDRFLFLVRYEEGFDLFLHLFPGFLRAVRVEKHPVLRGTVEEILKREITGGEERW